MYNGVKAMIKKEKELMPKQETVKDTQCGSHLKTHEELKGMPIFPAGTKSLLSKYLTRNIWENYKD